MSEGDQQVSAGEHYYKGFISYNYRDKEFAQWLHRKLENFRIPKGLLLPDGNADSPPRLKPIFRDREEMAAGHDLSSEIKAKLANSEYLIVVCSPHSARSRWVNEEIMEFRRQGRGQNILTVIAGGEPDATRVPGREHFECFPPGLSARQDEDGRDLGPALVPIAADARLEGDGRNNALLKIVAGMLHVQYDQLRRRNAEAQRRQLVGRLSIAAAVALMIAGSIIFGLVRQNNIAKADLFAAQAQAALAQKDYARAEMAAAESLLYRDDRTAREMLIQAQMGGVHFIARSPQLAADRPSAETAGVSRDGELAATVDAATSDGPKTVLVTRTRDGRVLWRITLPETAEMPNSIALDDTRGGTRRIAIAWPEKEGHLFRAAVWTLSSDAPPGQSRELTLGDAKLGRHSKRIPAMAFHPVQDWIVTCGEDGKLVLWDLATAAPKLIWEQENTHQPDVHGIAFSPDGKLLGSAGGDFVAEVWSVAAMAGSGYASSAPYRAHAIDPIDTLQGHSDSVFAIAFNPDGKHIATGGYDRTIRIWEFDGEPGAGTAKRTPPKTVATLNGNEGTVFALSYSVDGGLLVSGASDGGVDLWDSDSKLMNRFTPEQGMIRAVAAPSFERGVYMAGEEGWTAYSITGSPVLKRLWNGGGTIAVAAFDAKGDYLAAAGSGNDGKVRIWDRSLRLVQALDPQTEEESIDGIAFSPDGRWIAAGGAKKLVHVWQRGASQWPLVKQLNQQSWIWGLCFGGGGDYLFSSSQGGDEANEKPRIRRWKATDWSETNATPVLEDSVYALACDDRSNRLAAGDSRARVTLYDMTSLAPTHGVANVAQGELNVWSLAIAPDIHAIVSGNSDGRVGLWSPKDPAWGGSGELRKTGMSREDAADARVNPTINSVSYSAKYHLIAAGGVGPSVELYDSRTMRHWGSLRGHDGTIWWVAFDPTGTRLAYGGLDRILRVVDFDAMMRIFTERPATLENQARMNTGLMIRDNAIRPY
ncbi:MAG: toll/interleukin-1 receptor domain-containing protein [Sphingomonas sp.]